jgi:uncharacterized paraquat-inducible protein A
MSHNALANRSKDIPKEKTIKCPKCDYMNDYDANFCNICGIELVQLSVEEEASIKESWAEIRAGKCKVFDNADTYTESLKE